jgi:hypothetical protein
MKLFILSSRESNNAGPAFPPNTGTSDGLETSDKGPLVGMPKQKVGGRSHEKQRPAKDKPHRRGSKRRGRGDHAGSNLVKKGPRGGYRVCGATGENAR